MNSDLIKYIFSAKDETGNSDRLFAILFNNSSHNISDKNINNDKTIFISIETIIIAAAIVLGVILTICLWLRKNKGEKLKALREKMHARKRKLKKKATIENTNESENVTIKSYDDNNQSISSYQQENI
jgi:mannitol-specific phosphotransferase system IIBC component